MDDSRRLKSRPDSGRQQKGLKKELGLFDVFAISTVFSSGFFLLPGLAAAHSGPSVILAYLLSAVLVVPAMLSKAELSTAMPRAGGTYYFLDRSMGPMVGTLGGIGVWLALTLTSAFALIGMGAYLAIFFDVPVEEVALILTAGFMFLNILGAKETTGLQRFLVMVIISILAIFTVQGFVEIFGPHRPPVGERLSPFMPFGVEGLLQTTGLVFVSYAGLTKVSSVSEEVANPDRNIPLGMIISLITITLFHVVGAFLMVVVLQPDVLHESLTPVLETESHFRGAFSGSFGLALIVIAAVAAFVSAANAGILSASRYILAMARDRLLWTKLADLGRFRTPTLAICVTAAVMALCIVFLDVESVAKLASAFKLLVFALVNLAVIIMRESGLESYDPGFRSPLYPWMQIFGFLGPIVLIGELGHVPILYTVGVIGLSLVWYFSYVRKRVTRGGAVFHWFERLGRRRFEGLDSELRTILKEKGLREADPFDEVVARAVVVDIPGSVPFEAVVRRVAAEMARQLPIAEERLAEGLLSAHPTGATPGAYGAVLPHIRLREIETPQIAIVRSLGGIQFSLAEQMTSELERIHAAFFLVSPEGRPGQHLRLLAQIASRVDDEDFMEAWMSVENEQMLKESLLRDERFLSLRVTAGKRSESLIGVAIRDMGKPDGCLVALLRRGRQTMVPGSGTLLQEGDRLTVIGEPRGIRQLGEEYVRPFA
jgi:amino acid transporter/mannitol/fructose-specific phosphotransferase system IIA component (Ntr-type)